MGVSRSCSGVWRHALAVSGQWMGTAGHGTALGGAQRPACLSRALLLGVRSGVEVLDVVGGALGLGCRLHEERHVVA